jgi:hypothetical protein
MNFVLQHFVQLFELKINDSFVGERHPIHNAAYALTQIFFSQ